MNKQLIFWAGLATLTLTYAPAALATTAVPSAHSVSVPEDQSAILSHRQSHTQLNIQQHTQPDTQLSIPSNTQIYSEFRPLPASNEAPILIAPSPLPQRSPASNEVYIPLAPAPVSSDAQFATPIPSDLGLQFGLSNSATPKPPALAVAPSAPLPVPLSRSPIAPSPQLESKSPSAIPAPTPAVPAPAKPTDFTLGDLFAGGSDSLVAIVVGSAEGTRSPDGKPNENFYGHPDPGNGVWNLGTFSYQHGANSPEEADLKQLKRLKQQAQVIQEKATVNGLQLTLEETLNGIDLANQAPKAVIDGEGYVEWLVKAHQSGKSGAEAILWARVQSFIDPQTQRWDAPGLGNTADKIIHDQQRRMKAIDRAIAAQNYQIASDARLRSQPIGFQLPRWNFAGQIIQKVATLFH